MIDLSQNLPSVTSQPVTLNGEVFHIRRDMSAIERQMFRKYVQEDNDLAALAFVIAEHRAQDFKTLLDKYPVIQANEICTRIFRIAGLLPGEVSA